MTSTETGPDRRPAERRWSDQRGALYRTFVGVQSPTILLLAGLWLQRTLTSAV